MPSKTARSWQGSPPSSSLRRQLLPLLWRLGGTARKRCVLARRRSLSHSLGNALGALGPQLSRRGAESHREGQECHQAALGYTACNRATAMQRGTLALVLKHIHLSPIV